LVGRTPDWISFEMFLEHLSSAEDEFGVQALLRPLEKVMEKVSVDRLQENVVKLNQLGLDGMIDAHLEICKQQRIDEIRH